MATRLYFPASEAAAVSPAFDAGWNYTSEALRRRLAHVKGSSAVASGAQIGPWNNSAGQKALDRQYVSDALAAQTISGTCKGYLQVREIDAADNVDEIFVKAYVVSNDGSTVRGTLLALAAPGTQSEFNVLGERAKQISGGSPVASVEAQTGDRLVLEIGYSNTNAGTTPEALARWGENAVDCPENETETAVRAGWFELSANLVFHVPHPERRALLGAG